MTFLKNIMSINKDNMIVMLTILYVTSLIWIIAFKLDISYGFISSAIYFLLGLYCLRGQNSL